MDLDTIFKKSWLIQNWQYAVIACLVIVIFQLIKRRAVEVVVQHEQQTRVNSDYLDVDFADSEEQRLDDNVNLEAAADEYVPALEVQKHVPYKGASVTLPGGAAQFYTMAADRRSVRAYRRTPVPPLKIIQQCVLAAATAPSGAHTEPWTFCIVNTQSIKEKIRQIIEAEEEQNYSHRMNRQWTTDLQPLRTNHIKPYLTDAPYLILVFKQIYGVLPDGRRKQHYYNEISVSIATGLLLAALQSAGLSSLVTTPLNCGFALRRLLQRPMNEKLVVLLPVGYAAENCEVPDLKRKPLEEIMLEY